MVTDSLFLALSEEHLEDVFLPEKPAEWDQLRSEDCTDNFAANATEFGLLNSTQTLHLFLMVRESLISEELLFLKSDHHRSNIKYFKKNTLCNSTKSVKF